VVSTGIADTAFLEAEKELLARGVQKPLHCVGEKRFLGEFSAAPAVMVKIPAGLKTRPVGGSWTAWVCSDWCGHRAWARQTAAGTWAARHGVHIHACLEAAHGDDFLPLPDLDSEGTGSP
jgi:hypothetical protein